MLLKAQWFLALLLVGTLAYALAAPPAIGVAKARGNFRIDNASVYGNSTLFEGNSIETGRVASELRLQSGARVLLASNSRSRVFRDRLELERGAGQVSGSAYRVDARTLRIAPAASESKVHVALAKGGHIQVAALSGPVQVRNSAGLVVANIAAGSALDLDPQAAGAAAAFRITGCLARKNGKFVLTDETTKVTTELQGAGLEGEVGNRVEITGAQIPGATPVQGAAQVISVTALKQVGKGCAASGRTAAAAAGAAAGAGAAVAGLSTGVVVAIVGGVAAAATTVGLAASGVFTEEEEKPAASR